MERLSPQLAAEIVMASMHKLPSGIPPHFHNTYTPIAAAGTEGQVKHVCRLLATQLTSAKLGPGVDEMRRRAVLKRKVCNRNVKLKLIKLRLSLKLYSGCRR